MGGVFSFEGAPFGWIERETGRTSTILGSLLKNGHTQMVLSSFKHAEHHSKGSPRIWHSHTHTHTYTDGVAVSWNRDVVFSMPQETARADHMSGVE